MKSTDTAEIEEFCKSWAQDEKMKLIRDLLIWAVIFALVVYFYLYPQWLEHYNQWLENYNRVKGG